MIGHDIGVAIAAPLRHLARGQVIHPLVDQPRNLAVDQCNIDVLALACPGPVVQRGQNPRCRIHAAHHVGDPDAHLHRHAIRLSGQRHHPAVTLRHQVIARLGGVRAGLAIARDRAVDQPRVGRAQGRVVQPIFGQSSGFEVFHQNVGPCSQRPDRGLPVRAGDIHGDRQFVAVGRHEIGGQIGLLPTGVIQVGWPPAACIIPVRAGIFDLDDLGPQIAQQLRAGRPGQNPAQVQYGYSVQCACHAALPAVRFMLVGERRRLQGRRSE